MKRVHPAAAIALDDAELEHAYALPDPSRWRNGAWMRVNFVMSLDGSIVGAEGLSKSLGTDADRTVFRLARSMADVLLVGASTVRAEDYAPSTIPVAIVTRGMDLSPSLRMFDERGPQHARPIILTTDESAASAPSWLSDTCDVVACGSQRVDLTAAVAALTSRGLRAILCEGGPVLLDSLLAADLVDELLLTIVPRLVGSPEHLITRTGGISPPQRWSPSLVLEHDGTVLTRYQRP